MQIDWWTLALQAINVLILVWLLSRFLYQPVMKAITARQSAADAMLADARHASDQADAQTAALQAKNDGFTADAERRRAQMQSDIENERARLLAQARSEAQAMATQAAAAADADHARIAAEWQEKAGQLAGRMTGKLLQRLPAAETTDAMFKALVEQLQCLSETDRGKLIEDAPLTVLTACRVEAAAQARYLQALKDLLPDTLFEFAIDPGLIAAFELHGSHMRIRNSWRADLDAMLAALEENDDAQLA